MAEDVKQRAGIQGIQGTTPCAKLYRVYSRVYSRVYRGYTGGIQQVYSRYTGGIQQCLPGTSCSVYRWVYRVYSQPSDTEGGAEVANSDVEPRVL